MLQMCRTAAFSAFFRHVPPPLLSSPFQLGALLPDEWQLHFLNLLLLDESTPLPPSAVDDLVEALESWSSQVTPPTLLGKLTVGVMV